MEDHKTVQFMRLLSEDSIGSTLSSDSCEYYQTEIYDLLPSVQAVRSLHGGYDTQESHGGPEPEESRGPRDKMSQHPLRNLAMSMHGKRDARERRKMQISNNGFIKSWSRSQSINRKRIQAQVREMGFSLLPWRHILLKIQARFGVGVKSYFVFLRYLICLNLLHCALIGGFILGPTAFYGRNRTESLRFNKNDSVLDFFLGSGFLDRSPVFIGFYTPGSLDLSCLNTPLLYLAGILSIFAFSLIIAARRTTVGYKHTWMLEKRTSVNVSFKIFCGWDFNIQDPAAAMLKHSFIRNDLKLFLEEQSFSLRKAQRTLGQKSSDGWFLNLVLQYLSPITITFVNLILPHMFRKVSSFEDYSLTVQVNATLVRSIFLKLASLGIYLFFVFKTRQTQQEKSGCRENQLGREMYKLCIFNFIATFCSTFFVNYPRKLLQEMYPTSLLARLLGKQRFLIPFNVLDLVYVQTVSWVGVYYCPLLPLIGVVTLVATFYIKKVVHWNGDQCSLPPVIMSFDDLCIQGRI